jgi:hypothetical protein
MASKNVYVTGSGKVNHKTKNCVSLRHMLSLHNVYSVKPEMAAQVGAGNKCMKCW